MDNMLHDIFIQEAEENLEILENLIITLEETPDDSDTINEAFRAIHSLKGGAGLAGFSSIKDFAHIVEDLFENIRNGSLSITEDLISVILNAMDILKLMIANIKEGLDADEGVETEGTEKEIRAILGSMNENPGSREEEKKEDKKGKRLFYLSLEYGKDLFLTGIDPLMFLSDLASRGTILAAEAFFEDVPEPDEFDPESMYLQWKIFYETEMNEKELTDIFCFVIDESNLAFTDLTALKEKGESMDRYTVRNMGADELEFRKAPAEASAVDESGTAGSADRRKGDRRTGEISDEDVPMDRRQGDRRKTDRRKVGTVDSYIRVPTDKLEKIFNTVSELLISQARLNMLTEEHEDILPDSFSTVTDSLKNITQILQEQVTSLRMMNLGSTFDRFKRVVRDMASERGKKIRLNLSGQDTELDKNMIEKLNDPLKHLVRNCIDHGIETTEERLKLGKSEEGHLELAAYLESGKVVIEVSDDGRGINRQKLLDKAEERGIISKDTRLNDGEILNLIFHPGLSTAEAITDLSGRGVGMDVVKSSINELHGNVDIISGEGTGTTFKLYLPLTLAILDGMLISIGAEKYIIPTLSILEIFRPEAVHLKSVSGGEELIFFRGNYIPMIRLHRIFNISEAILEPSEAEVIVINSGGIKAAILVDNVLEQYQIVLKSLQKNFRKVEHISSATILGDGDVALIVDIQSLVKTKQQAK
ncbi:MAG: chemotaxis protein CheA [Spirochaetales bacterium]|nr:chemotaxis protein CheA [Spirochaetales bacterium]